MDPQEDECGNADGEDVIELLNETDLNHMLDSLRLKAVEGNETVGPLLRAMFRASPPSNDQSLQRRVEIYKFAVRMLETVEFSTRDFTNLVSVLIDETEKFPTSKLMKIANFLSTELRECRSNDGKWLEVLPKILSTLATRDTIVYQGIDNSGAQLKRLALKWMCNNASNPTAATQLASALRDVEMTKEESEFVVEEMLSIMPELKHEDLPTYVHQLLQFRVGDLQRKILQFIMKYFIDEDNRVREEADSDHATEYIDQAMLHQIEGSIILMIQCSGRQNHSLCKVFLSMLKDMTLVPEVALSPFVFSCALSLSQIQKFRDEVFDVLKSTVLRVYRHQEKIDHSFWIREILPAATNVTSYVKEAIENSKHGWDHVGQGLVNFGFVLLDTFGPKYVSDKASNLSKPHIKSAPERVCLLGNMILRHTFKTNSLTRSEIFDQLLNRIVSKSVCSVTHYVDVLSRTVQGDPQLLLQALSKVIEIIDFLPSMPYQNATALLRALTLLLKISMPLKDALMLVLRKALFNCDIETRKIAITGYFAVLKRLTSVGKVSLSESQTSVSSQSSTASLHYGSEGKASTNTVSRSRGMCLEIMGILKRVLMQQSEVKQLLYEGVYDVIVNNPSLADVVLELLLSQLEKFYNGSDSSKPPLDLKSCAEKTGKNQVIKDEPIGHLIMSIYLILYEIKDKDDETGELDDDFDTEQSAQMILQDILGNLVKKVSKMDLKVYDLDPSPDSSDDMLEKKDMILLLLHVYDSLIEYCFMKNRSFCTSDCEEALELLVKRRNVYRILSDKSGKSKKASKMKLNWTVPPHFTLRFLAVILDALFSDGNPRHKEGLDMLRANDGFVKFMLETFNNKLKLFLETGKHDGFSECMPNLNKYIYTVVRVFLKVYTDGLDSSFSSSDQSELLFLIADGMRLAFSMMFCLDGALYMKFIEEIGRQAPASHGDAAVRLMKKFQRLVIRVLSDTSDDDQLNQVLPLLSIISNLTLVPTNRDNEEIYEWVKQLCVSQTFEDTAITKKLLSLCLSLSHQHKDNMKFLQEIANDLHRELGDIEPSTEIPGTTTYPIINGQSAPGLITLFVSSIEQVIEEVEWMLNTMKGQLTYIAAEKNTDSQCEKAVMEDQVFVLVLNLIKVIKKILETSVPVGGSSNSVLKVTTSMYKCLGLMCAYFIAQYDKKSSGGLHPEFEKIVKFSWTHFTPQVYSFFTYIQNVQMQSINASKKTSSNPMGKTDEKVIPPVVFEIEKYEQRLIVLSKKAKKNLLAHAKHSTSRDFRINPAAIEAVAEGGNESEEDETAGVEPQASTAGRQNQSALTHSKNLHQKSQSSKRKSVNEKGSKKKGMRT